MSEILVCSENRWLAAELIGCGLELNAPISAVAFKEEDAAALANYALEKVYLLQGASQRPEDYAGALAELAGSSSATLLLVGDSVSGRELAAKCAARLGLSLAAGLHAIRRSASGLETTRMVYGGAVLQTESYPGRLVATVPAGKFNAAEQTDKPAEIVWVEAEVDGRVQVLQRNPIHTEAVDLHSSKAVVGVGLGFNQKEDLGLAFALADALHAAVGCTRPVAEEKKWLPVEQYIGISGVAIAPDLYLTAGISGQIQHMVGVREAKLIVAIDKNASAAIFREADYGIVGDLYSILPLLTEALRGK